MTPYELKARTKKFAIDIIRFVESMPKSVSAGVIGKQLIRSGTSVAANYRASQRGKSKPDFINKIAIVEEEADESLFWLEIAEEILAERKSETKTLIKEADELTAIFTTIRKTSKLSLNKK